MPIWFILNAFHGGRRASLLFMNLTVTDILHWKACYFFYSHRDKRGLAIITFAKMSKCSTIGKLHLTWLFIMSRQEKTVCYCHVTHAFQSESTLDSYLNVKELLARSRSEIWSLSDCSWTRTQNQLVRKRKRPVWPNGWVFVYKLSGSEFEFSCSHSNFRFPACFEQVVPSHSGNYRVSIHSETHTWHDKNIKSNAACRSNLAKWLSVRLRTKWFWVPIQLQSRKNCIFSYNL